MLPIIYNNNDDITYYINIAFSIEHSVYIFCMLCWRVSRCGYFGSKRKSSRTKISPKEVYIYILCITELFCCLMLLWQRIRIVCMPAALGGQQRRYDAWIYRFCFGRFQTKLFAWDDLVALCVALTAHMLSVRHSGWDLHRSILPKSSQFHMLLLLFCYWRMMGVPTTDDGDGDDGAVLRCFVVTHSHLLLSLLWLLW